ncbi:MAG: phospholipase D-like domain-containing protein, partial [Oscillospiraceae bacterium]
KVTQGVDVRVIYDGVGSGSVLPYKYFRKLEQFGIKAKVFSPFVPFLSVLQNNRDHRKICVVDGISAICGGINIGDEYINVEERFGHWKDSSVLLRGDAAYTFAIMFLQMWLLSGSEESNFESFRPLPCESDKFKCDGFSAPYGDCPLDDETVGKFVYLDIINNAKKYVYITTPYLILDNEMTTSLCFASKRGVDVRIILPKIPDKWYAYSVAISHFEELISSGIKIYKYTPGFIHSKTFVADDEISVVGSINLDFRSLYLHYECAVWMFKTKSVIEVFDDFTETLKVSTPVTLEDCTKIGSLHRMLNAVLRLFAPMM